MEQSNVYTLNITITYNASEIFYTLTRESYAVFASAIDSNDTKMMKITTANATIEFTVYVAQNEAMTLDIIQTQGFNVSKNSGCNTSYTVFDLFSSLNETVSNVSIGIVPVLTSDFDSYARSIIEHCEKKSCSVTIPVEFTMNIYKVSCKYWNIQLDSWTTEGCTVIILNYFRN